ncbi:MAG: L-lactate dehydrogenase [Xanthomonadales bacterium]|nr:L-lactate dehydrogenase [Gammaproteobacteria bacterium]MBT8051988.1 L-lactate dehydrogenase [Gammaproteobacteria bacterium]MBT8056440.1 L-lactate dehydrogenase [Gammaproteobacteria bacterium]NNJ78334.1 L-lactate dehydrogenase [Xanthomonadales bacterium]NNL03960.1 L-lactate dehydrogenase [Xanthomonadales bacterium]
MSPSPVIPVTAADYRLLAKKRLPRFLFDYIDGGAGEECSLARNVAAFGSVALKQRVMRDVSRIDTAAMLLGQRVSMPVVLAPVALAGMYRRRGEAQAARGARKAGVPFTTSTMGICSVAEVQGAAGGGSWYQLYMLRDRGVVEAILDRVRDAGVETLVFTVDLPMLGKRYRDDHNGVMAGGFRGASAKALQLVSRPRWLWDVGLRGKPHDFGNLAGVVRGVRDLDGFKAFIDSQFDPSVTWADLGWLRERWAGSLVIKGVMGTQDAIAAADAGADAVVVSNHGGRQLDGVASSLSKLPEVADAVGDRLEVLMDGGARNGTDIIKAIARGARGVMLGRAWAWALAARGERGVADLLEVIQMEIANSMALMGVNRIDEIDAGRVEPSP